MHWVPLEYADWMPEVRPLHHASARPRLHVPRDVLKRTIQAEPSIPHSLRCWYACDVPIGQEHPTEQTFFRKTLTHPVLNTPLAVWVPCNRLQQPIWPGYVLAVSDTALDARELSRLRLTLSGFLGGHRGLSIPCGTCHGKTLPCRCHGCRRHSVRCSGFIERTAPADTPT